MDKRAARGPAAAGANDPPTEQVQLYCTNTPSALKKVTARFDGDQSVPEPEEVALSVSPPPPSKYLLNYDSVLKSTPDTHR